jgi:hypothetical protein
MKWRLLFSVLLPVVAYAIFRDTLGLAVAGAVPVGYGIVLAVWRRRVDWLAVVASIAFAIACVAAALTGSALPLKVHEAVVTGALGLVLLAAVAVRRPVPLARLLKTPAADDSVLGVLVGGFLLLHALIHVVLALTLPTGEFVVVSRVVGWSLIGAGVAGLIIYRRRTRLAP